MPRAAYCGKCAAYVWLDADGCCPQGHDRESLGDSYEAQAASGRALPNVPRERTSLLRNVVTAAAAIVAALSMTSLVGAPLETAAAALLFCISAVAIITLAAQRAVEILIVLGAIATAVALLTSVGNVLGSVTGWTGGDGRFALWVLPLGLLAVWMGFIRREY